MKPLRRIGAVLVLSLGLAACTAASPQFGGRGVGPLGDIQSTGQICVPADTQGRVTNAFEHLANTGGRPLTIEDVRLVDATNLRLDQASVVPLDGQDLLGLFPGRFDAAQPDQAPASPMWERRETVPGATIARGDGTTSGPADGVNLVLELTSELPDQPGSVRTVEVDYIDDDGNKYRWTSGFAFSTVPDGARCTP